MPTVPVPLLIAFAGLLSLAVAVGIGRFAFTPILPMMLAERRVDLGGASWLASANYLGYMLGAVGCTLQPWIRARLPGLPAPDQPTLVRSGLVATVLLTLAMALDWPGAWPALRFAAGVASAVVFVFTNGWCLARLAHADANAMGGLIYVGPGAGIIVSGLSVTGMVAGHWTSAAAWTFFGGLAALLTLAVWPLLRGGTEPPASPPRARTGTDPNRVAVAAPAARARTVEVALLALAYGLAGLGYIITATFLPVIAREALPGSRWLDLFWPMFGVGTILGALLAMRVPAAGDRRMLLIVCYLIQALGIGSSLISPTLPGFVVGSLLLGMPFTAITFFAMQEARRLRPAAAASFIGLLTATYGVGQIVGPPMTAGLLAGSRTTAEGFTLSLQMAAGALLAGAMLFAGMRRAYPLPSRPASESGSAAHPQP